MTVAVKFRKLATEYSARARSSPAAQLSAMLERMAEDFATLADQLERFQDIRDQKSNASLDVRART